MQLTLTNVSNPAVPIFVSDLYTTIQPGETVTFHRELTQIPMMASMQNYISQGSLTLTVQALPFEIGSGTLAPLPPLFIAAEWDNPPTASAAAIMPATATVSGSVTYVPTTAAVATAGYLLNLASLAANSRDLTITGGGTTGNCPTSAVVTGLDAAGNPQTETIALTAGSGTGVYAWSSLISVQFLGGTGTAGTEEIGFGLVLGLKFPPLLRAGLTSPFIPYFPEIVNGVVLTTNLGTIDATHHTFTPHTVPNGATSYALYYEASQAAPG